MDALLLRMIHGFVPEFQPGGLRSAALEPTELEIGTARGIGNTELNAGDPPPRALYPRVRLAAESAIQAQKRAADVDEQCIAEQVNVIEGTETIKDWFSRVWERYKSRLQLTNAPGHKFTSQVCKLLGVRKVAAYE